MTVFRSRLATTADIPQISELMLLAIQENMKAFMAAEEIEAAKESMGVDRLLIADGTYFVIETDSGVITDDLKQTDAGLLVGCGGWGRRKTLYGGDHTTGRDDALSDPATDAARIRAMYTHPDWTRRGIGSLLLDLGEAAAREAGFKTIELGATVPGEPLYLARGYRELSREITPTANGAGSVIIKMAKAL